MQSNLPDMGGEARQRKDLEERVQVVDEAFQSAFPKLSHVLGTGERARLAAEFVRSRPFYAGGRVGLDRMLIEFLSVALAEDPERGPWLSEFAQLEGSLGRAAQTGGSSELVELHAFEHRVDELLGELTESGTWNAPRPADVHLSVHGGPDGVRCTAIDRDSWAQLAQGDGHSA